MFLSHMAVYSPLVRSDSNPVITGSDPRLALCNKSPWRNRNCNYLQIICKVFASHAIIEAIIISDVRDTADKMLGKKYQSANTDHEGYIVHCVYI